MAHVLTLDISYHHETSPGELIERIDGDVTALSNFFSRMFVSLAGGLILALGVLVLLWREHPYVGLAMTGFATLCLVVLLRSRRLGARMAVRQREASSRLFGFLEERLAGIEDIRANGAGHFVMDGFHRANHEFFHVTRFAWMLRSFILTIVVALFACGDLLSLGLGAWFHLQGLITLGTVILLFRYTAMMRGPIEMVTRQIQDLQRAAASLERITEMFAQKSLLEQGAGVELPSGPVSLDIDGLTFAYHAGNPVLKDVSLHLAPGRHLGLLGRTGSGKTTLTRLICRLYDPQQGLVSLGGVDVRESRLNALRGHIGVVTQNVQIFRATIRENLTFFDDTIPDDHIVEVIGQLGLTGWLDGFDRGLDTLLAGEGRGLSSGEAQLLGVARVFLKRPQLVILDEPSSRLDPHTDALLQRAMQGLLQGRTAIIIAHRLSTIRHVDDVLILHEGSVVEQGERAVLEQQADSRFAHLLRVGMEGELS